MRIKGSDLKALIYTQLNLSYGQKDIGAPYFSSVAGAFNSSNM